MPLSNIQIHFPVEDNDTSRRIRDWVASGRGTLKHVLGSAEQRQRLFLPGLQHDRILAAVNGDEPVGYSTFSFGGKGPLAPVHADFVREYGRLSAPLRQVVFRLTNLQGRSGAFYLYAFQVRPEQRRLGIGRLMLDRVIEEGGRHACKSIELHVALNNDKAIGFYRQRGFEDLRVIRPGPFASLFSVPGWLHMALPL